MNLLFQQILYTNLEEVGEFFERVHGDLVIEPVRQLLLTEAKLLCQFTVVFYPFPGH